MPTILPTTSDADRIVTITIERAGATQTVEAQLGSRSR